MHTLDELHYGARIDGATYKIRSSGFHAIAMPEPLGIDSLRHHGRAAGMLAQWLAFDVWVPAAGLAEFVTAPTDCSACKGKRVVPCPYCEAAHAREQGCSWCDEDGEVDCDTCLLRPATILGHVFNRALVADVFAEMGAADEVGLFEETREEGRAQLLFRHKRSPALGIVMSMDPERVTPDGVWP